MNHVGDDAAERQRLAEAISARIKRLESGAGKPTVVMRSRVRWLGNLLCEAHMRDVPPVRMDEPAAMGGGDTAANPMEMVLAALGACMEINYSAYASLLGIPLDSVEVTVSGYMDLREMFDLKHECGAGFTKVNFETHIQSPASEDTIRRLIETVERCCPVKDTLARPVPLTGQIRLNDRALD